MSDLVFVSYKILVYYSFRDGFFLSLSCSSNKSCIILINVIKGGYEVLLELMSIF